MGILLASFMGGMCLGSFALAWVVPARWHPLRVYAVLELAIGEIGGTLPWWLPKPQRLVPPRGRRVTGRDFGPSGRGRGDDSPRDGTMGATLPAVARWVKSTPAEFAQLGVFYGANTIGAVIGCLAAGFWLLRETDTIVASHAAAGINAFVALAAFSLAFVTPYQAAEANEDARDCESVGMNPPAIVCLVIALSGFAALGAEVVWTRLLSQLFGSTVYTFAIILAVFLGGLGIGSTAAARLVERAVHPLRWLALAQLAVVCLAPWANLAITRVVPYWPRPAVTQTRDTYAVFAHDTLRTAVAVFPSALLWARAFRLRSRPRGGDNATRAGWSARFMPPTRSGRSLARWSPARC